MKQVQSPIALGDYEPTIGVMLKNRSENFGTKIALQERIISEDSTPRFKGRSWLQLYDEIARIGASFIEIGIVKGDKIAIVSRNRYEMLLLEAAVMSIGAMSVPVFSEYPPPQLDYILTHSDARFLVTSDQRHLDTLLRTEVFKRLERIYVMDTFQPPELNNKNITTIYPFHSLLKPSNNNYLKLFEEHIEEVGPCDPCLIMYTSGTTGLPKGVVLCHCNILSQQKAVSLLWDMGPEDRFLSYLPWHHSFGGLFERFRALYSGATFTIDDSYGKDLPRLIENFKAIQPTVYFSAPKIYQAIVAEAKLDKEIENQLIHSELKFIFTAAAPLPKDISDYFKSKNIPVVEGWGLTETSPCCTLTSINENRQSGLVGHPIPGVTIKISDKGEILVKGPNLMLEYYKAPKENLNIIDKEGWLHTGDLGEITPDGLRIKGRLDGVFKLTNGEKVSSHSVEVQLVGSNDFIDVAVVTGPGREFVAGLIVPNFTTLAAWAAKHQIHVSEQSELIRDKQIRKLLASEVNKSNTLINPKYSRIKTAAVIKRVLSIERGELTPSLKVVRNKVIENYSEAVEAMYRYAEIYKVKEIEPTESQLLEFNLLKLT